MSGCDPGEAHYLDTLLRDVLAAGGRFLACVPGIGMAQESCPFGRAMHIARRYGEFAHVVPAPPLGRMPFHPASRAPFPINEEEAATVFRRHALRHVFTVEDGTDLAGFGDTDTRPVHDAASVLAGRSCATFADVGDGRSRFAHLAIAAHEAATEAGRAPPLLFGPAETWFERLADRLGLDVLGIKERQLRPTRDPDPANSEYDDVVVSMFAAPPGSRFPRSIVGFVAHASSLPAKGDRHPVPVPISDGIVGMEADGVHVLATRCEVWDEDVWKPACLVASIDRRGWLHVAVDNLERSPGAEIGDDRLIREAWSGWFDATGSRPRPQRDLFGRDFLVHSPAAFLRSSCFRGDRLDAFRDRISARLPQGGLSIVDAAACSRKMAPAVFDWTRMPDGHGLRRSQFVITFPALGVLGLDPAIGALVDAGQSPIAAMADRIGITPGIVRRLVGVRHLPFGRLETLGPCGTLDGMHLTEWGHGSLPPAGDFVGWHALASLVPMLQFTLPEEYHMQAEGLAQLGACMGGPTMQDRLAAFQGLDQFRRDGIRDLFRALSHWVETFFESIVPFHRIYAAYPSLDAILHAVDLWHATPILMASSGITPPDSTWSIPFDPVDLGDGWVATPLASMKALRDEGGFGPDENGIDGLAHCVAGYGWKCVPGESVILSLSREIEGSQVRVSTVELAARNNGRWNLSGRSYDAVQHRGYRNAEPSEEAVARLEALAERVASGGVPFLSFTEPASPDPLAAPFRHPEPAALYPYWRPILPAALGKLDLDGFLRAMSVEAEATEAAA